MWRHAQRVARQAFSSSGAFTRAAAPAASRASCSGGSRAAMRAAAACNTARQGGGLASSAGFQAFKQSMGARSMGFAASAPSVSGKSSGSSCAAKAGGSSASSSVECSSEDDSNPTSPGLRSASRGSSGSSSSSSLALGEEDDDGAVKRRRTKKGRLRARQGNPLISSFFTSGARPASPLAAAPGKGPFPHFGAGCSPMIACMATWRAPHCTTMPGRDAAHVRVLHTGSAAQQAEGRREVGPMGPMKSTKPTADMITEGLIFSKESFLSKPDSAVPIPKPIREVMYQHRWDKVLVDVRRAVSFVKSEGKREQYTAMVAVGNMKGLFGLGLGDAPTAQESVAAAYLDAFNKLNTVPLYRSHTIFNHIEHKYNSLKFLISPRPEGWGISANDLVLELCNLAGIRNINVKVYGRRRPKFYVAAGFLEAIMSHQTVPHDGVEGSGIYVREVLPPSWHARGHTL